MNTDKLINSINKIKDTLEEEDEQREKVIKLQRNCIRTCGEAIKSVHREEFDVADEKIKEAKRLKTEMVKKVKGQEGLECWGGLLSAYQELAEAIITNAIIRDDEIPGVEECDVPNASYLLGLGDAIGELRRYLMNSLKERDFDNARRAFEYMEFIYSELMSIDYPKMLVGPLRSKVDYARSMVNKTRSDLINAIQANELEKSMKSLSQKLDD